MGDGTLWFVIITFVLTLAIIGTLIYLYVYVFRNISALYNINLEIKSKIGSLIREINNNNQQEYLADLEQQNSIDSLKVKVAQEKP